MRRFTAIWKFASGAYQDYTAALGDGSVAVTISAGEKLYMGADDWLSGCMLFVSTEPSSSLVYSLQQYDGDSWKNLPLEESVSQLGSGIELQRGSTYWGTSPYKWQKLAPTTTDPETATPPDLHEQYWIRLVVTSGGSVTIYRALPQLYNTYCTVAEVAAFLSLSIDDVRQPTSSDIRKLIRAHEDWIDDFSRRTWRPRIRYNEMLEYNPFGVKLRAYRPWFVIDLGVWNGSSFEDKTEGRSQDYFLDLDTGMLRFTQAYSGLRRNTWMHSRKHTQPGRLRITYAYGEDFEVSSRRQLVHDIVVKLTAADVVISSDWTGVIVSTGDDVPKEARARYWQEEATSRAEQLRRLGSD